MATINGAGGNGDGFTRMVNWLMGIASAVIIGGIFALVGLSWNNNYTLGNIQGQLSRIESNQIDRDNEQNRWINYLRQRLDNGRQKPEPDQNGN